MKLTIMKKFGLLLLLPASGALIALGVFYSVFTGTASDGHFINVAGRQRMLSEQLLASANKVRIGQEEDRKPLRELVATFDQSLRVLEEGGQVMGKPLPPAPPEVRVQIAAVKRLWSGTKASLLVVADRPVADPAAEKAYQYVQSDIPLLTKASDRVVVAFEERREALRHRVLGTLSATAGFDLILLIAGLWLVKRYIVRPILSTVEAARRVRAGDFSHQVPIVSGDELATLASTFNEMSVDLAQLLAERERTGAQLQHMADHDALTGLFNRRRFQEELGRQLAEARRYGTHGALMFIDLDGFKHVNDRLGHEAGDDLLVSVAGILQGQLRETDTLARLGGDEFAILLPQADPEQARMAAERILQAFGDQHMVVFGQLIDITASIGIALFPEHGTMVEQLLSHADRAMYQAKENGRNDFYVYAPDMDWRAQVESKFTWEKRIREALKKDLFLLYCQPILDLRSDRISHYELLLRMAGERDEVILPSAFIGVAERFGLIRDIDRWVVRRAIHLIADYHRAGREITLEVNLSGKSFADNELLPLIRRELAVTSVNPAHLVLAITESAAIADTNQAQKFIEDLKGLGCQFAIDDFGAGFSSFFHLKHLSVDYLKIHGGFIRNLPHDPVDQHIVKAMVEVARGLGKRIVAESVENGETMRLVREYGVDYAQGYHIRRPCSVTEILPEVASKVQGVGSVPGTL